MYLGYRDALNADVRNRLPDIVQLEGFDDGGDQLHAFIPAFTCKSDRLLHHFRVLLILKIADFVPPPADDESTGYAAVGQALHPSGAQLRHSCLNRVRSLHCDPVLEAEMSFINSNGLDDLAKRLADSVPESLRAFGRDLESNFKAVLQAQLAKLDLVTRQDFDVQAAILERTQGNLTALEARLKDLEAKLTPQ